MFNYRNTIKETHLRSFFKGVTFRFVATLTTMALVYMFTGNFALTLSVGLIETVSKLIIYYLHERFWDRIRWGRCKEKKTGT